MKDLFNIIIAYLDNQSTVYNKAFDNLINKDKELNTKIEAVKNSTAGGGGYP